MTLTLTWPSADTPINTLSWTSYRVTPGPKMLQSKVASGTLGRDWGGYWGGDWGGTWGGGIRPQEIHASGSVDAVTAMLDIICSELASNRPAPLVPQGCHP